MSVVLLVTVLVTAFGSSASAPPPPLPAPAERLVPPGPPRPSVVATHEQLRLQLPIAQQRVTAIGYHAAGNGALALEPVGRRANEGLLGRLVRRIFGGDTSGPVYYQLAGGEGAETGSLNVGATPETDVYSPVDGTVVGMADFVLDGRPRGARIDVQPRTAPSVVVSLTRLRPDPSLTVGSTVVSGTTRIGSVLDLSGLERQALARYTQDAGNHVALEVYPAAALGLS